MTASLGVSGRSIVICYHLELKHHERCTIWEWLLQAESEARPTDCPVVIFRRNRSRAYAVLPVEDLLELVRFRETAG